GRVIDASVRGNAARWINHSCAPNCESQEDDDGRVFIEAKRPIAKGEELTYDYRLTIDGRLTKAEREWFTCRCGAARCRGTMLAKKPSASGPKKQGSAKKAKKAGKATDAGKTAKAGKAKDAGKTAKATKAKKATKSTN